MSEDLFHAICAVMILIAGIFFGLAIISHL